MLMIDCGICDGRGEIRGSRCRRCKGTGVEPATAEEKGKMLDDAYRTLEQPTEFE